MQTISLWYVITLKYLTWYLCAELKKISHKRLLRDLAQNAIILYQGSKKNYTETL